MADPALIASFDQARARILEMVGSQERGQLLMVVLASEDDAEFCSAYLPPHDIDDELVKARWTAIAVSRAHAVVCAQLTSCVETLRRLEEQQ